MAAREMTPEELKARMDALDLAPKQIALAAGVTPQAVYYWLNGERPIPVMLDAVLTLAEVRRERTQSAGHEDGG